MASPPSYSLKLADRLVTILFRVNLESCLQLIFIQTHTVTTYVFLPLSFPLLSAAIFHEVSSLRNNAVTVHPLNSKSGKRDFLCSDKRQYSSQSKEREREHLDAGEMIGVLTRASRGFGVGHYGLELHVLPHIKRRAHWLHDPLLRNMGLKNQRQLQLNKSRLLSHSNKSTLRQSICYER